MLMISDHALNKPIVARVFPCERLGSFFDRVQVHVSWMVPPDHDSPTIEDEADFVPPG
jgi:hypothetical protein